MWIEWGKTVMGCGTNKGILGGDPIASESETDN